MAEQEQSCYNPWDFRHEVWRARGKGTREKGVRNKVRKIMEGPDKAFSFYSQ